MRLQRLRYSGDTTAGDLLLYSEINNKWSDYGTFELVRVEPEWTPLPATRFNSNGTPATLYEHIDGNDAGLIRYFSWKPLVQFQLGGTFSGVRRYYVPGDTHGVEIEAQLRYNTAVEGSITGDSTRPLQEFSAQWDDRGVIAQVVDIEDPLKNMNVQLSDYVNYQHTSITDWHRWGEFKYSGDPVQALDSFYFEKEYSREEVQRRIEEVSIQRKHVAVVNGKTIVLAVFGRTVHLWAPVIPSGQYTSETYNRDGNQCFAWENQRLKFLKDWTVEWSNVESANKFGMNSGSFEAIHVSDFAISERREYYEVMQKGHNKSNWIPCIESDPSPYSPSPYSQPEQGVITLQDLGCIAVTSEQFEVQLQLDSEPHLPAVESLRNRNEISWSIWKKDGGNVEPMPEALKGLTFKDVQISTAGQYELRINDSNGDGHAGSIVISVGGEPKISVPLPEGEWKEVKYPFCITEPNSLSPIVPAVPPVAPEPAWDFTNARWSACSATCGTGTKTLTGQCMANGAPVDRRGCTGQEIQQKECNVHPCPPAVPPVAPEPAWDFTKNLWSVCSVPCGGGIKTRTGMCMANGKSVDPRECTRQNYQEEVCNEDPCPDVHRGEWFYQESPCSSECGSGTQSYTPVCFQDGKRVDVRMCPPTQRPQGYTQPCETQCVPQAGWVYNLPNCPPCGGGHRSAHATCMNGNRIVNSSNCLEKQPPYFTEACNTPACEEPVRAEWTSISTCKEDCTWETTFKCQRDGTDVAEGDCGPQPLGRSGPCDENNCIQPSGVKCRKGWTFHHHLPDTEEGMIYRFIDPRYEHFGFRWNTQNVSHRSNGWMTTYHRRKTLSGGWTKWKQFGPTSGVEIRMNALRGHRPETIGSHKQPHTVNMYHRSPFNNITLIFENNTTTVDTCTDIALVELGDKPVRPFVPAPVPSVPVPSVPAPSVPAPSVPAPSCACALCACALCACALCACALCACALCACALCACALCACAHRAGTALRQAKQSSQNGHPVPRTVA